jgi:dienelactone hydrolase
MRSSVFGLVLVLASWAAFAATLSASADELVAFKTAGLRSGENDIQGYLTKPKGAGPFPAVVLLHSCLGLPSNRQSIGEAIAGWGYVALFVDDFATRGLKETCSVDFNEALADAYGGLDYVGRLSDVDPTRIAAVGFSQGADTALQIAAARLASRDRLKFKAAAAFYPPCANQSGVALRLPTLILIGGADAVTPSADCERLAKSQPADAKLIVYPGAGHVFDDPEFAGGKRVLGMWLDYDRKAAAQSRAALRAFLSAEFAR